MVVSFDNNNERSVAVLRSWHSPLVMAYNIERSADSYLIAEMYKGFEAGQLLGITVQGLYFLNISAVLPPLQSVLLTTSLSKWTSLWQLFEIKISEVLW